MALVLEVFTGLMGIPKVSFSNRSGTYPNMWHSA